MVGATPRLRILVADDAPEIARRVCKLLEESGLEVVGPAYDGVSALRIYEASLPEGAVLDLSMPKLDGLGVLAAIRAGGRACVAIVLTSHTEPSLRAQALAAGADAFLSKADEFERVVEIFWERLPQVFG